MEAKGSQASGLPCIVAASAQDARIGRPLRAVQAGEQQPLSGIAEQGEMVAQQDGQLVDDRHAPFLAGLRGDELLDVIEVSLTHMKLGATAAAYGKAELDGGEAVLVVTEDEAGNTRASLRQPDGGIAELEPDPELAGDADA